MAQILPTTRFEWFIYDPHDSPSTQEKKHRKKYAAYPFNKRSLFTKGAISCIFGLKLAHVMDQTSS